MNKVNFDQVKIKNFLSIGNDPVVVRFKTGLNIITGNNRDKEDRRNGVGKSSVADAINFAIFGNTLRDIKNDNISNDSTTGSCEVTLDFSIEFPNNTKQYKIVRSLNPSKVFLYIDGIDKTLDTISNTNDFICSLLNCSQEVFDNCVIMTLNNTLPFMGKKKQDKRKFIEGIFNLEVFSEMLVNAKNEYTLIKKDQDVQIGKLSENSSTLSEIKIQQSTFLARKQTKINSLKLNVDTLQTTRATLEANFKKLKDIDFVAKKLDIQTQIVELVNKKNEEDKKISAFIGKEATCAANVSNKEKALQKITASVGQCPVCLHNITSDDKTHIESEKQKIKDEVISIKTEQEAFQKAKKACIDAKSVLDKDISDKNTKIQAIDKLQLQYTSISNQLITNQSSIDQFNKQIVDAEAEEDTLGKLVGDLEIKVKEHNKQIEKSKIDLQLLDQVKFVLSEEGVKSFLIKRILDVLNSRISYYLDKLDANCSCVFNEYFEEQIVNDKGKTSSYYNFSGAERKNIDLACLFTFMDIRRLQGDVTFNISLYDELLDSSLDEKGIELVLGILKERIEKYNESIFVISHRKESVKFATGEVIMLEKHNGITRRVDSAA